MFYLTIVAGFAFVSGLAFLVAFFGKATEQKVAAGVIGTVLGGLAALLLGFAMFVVVPPGHVGVPVVLGSVQNRVLHEGFSFVNPLASIEEMSVRTENYTFSKTHEEGDKVGDDAIVALSSNGMQLSLDITVPYRLVPEAAPWVLRNFGRDYREKILRPAICTAVREATSHFPDQDAYAKKREELAIKMSERLLARVDDLAAKEYSDAPKAIFSLPQVMLRNVALPESVKKAIELKVAADQENQAMEFAILKEEKRAKQRIIEAEGIQKFQSIVAKGVTPDLLKWKGIEATELIAQSPNSKVIIIGGRDGLPVILGDMGSSDGRSSDGGSIK